MEINTGNGRIASPTATGFLRRVQRFVKERAGTLLSYIVNSSHDRSFRRALSLFVGRVVLKRIVAVRVN